MGLPWWLRWQRICLQCRRPGCDPWVEKIPWKKAWEPTPVFLPGESHKQRSLVASVHGVTRIGHDLATNATMIEWLIHIRKNVSQRLVAPASIWKEHSQRHILARPAVWVSFWFLFHSQLGLSTEKKCADHIGLQKECRTCFSCFFKKYKSG